MKRFIAIVAALLCTGALAHAQLGVMAGVTSTESDIKSAAVNAESITQYHVGLAMRFPVGSIFAIQPAAIYNIKGQQLGSVLDTGFQADFKTGFVEVPVQLQVGFDIMGFRPYVFAEPFVGYAVNNESKQYTASMAEDLANGDPVTSTDWTNVKSRIEYGAGLGFGIDLLNHMQISARYFWNMGPLYSDNAIDTTIDDVSAAVTQNKCTGIMVSAALFF